MKVFIDADLCISCGLCVDTCSDIFEMGADAAEVIVPVVPADREDCAVEAEEACPTDAITHE
jgi:ferredoxin